MTVTGLMAMWLPLPVYIYIYIYIYIKVYDRNVVNKYGICLLLVVMTFNLIDYVYIYIPVDVKNWYFL